MTNKIKNNQSHKKNWGAQIEHGVQRKDHLGNTNTPQDVARMIVDKTIDSIDLTHTGKWLEPAVGTGNFYICVLDKFKEMGGDPLDLAKNFDAIDIDIDAINVLKKRLNEKYGWSEEIIKSLPIYHTSLLDFKPTHKYNIIITNPPFLAPKKWSEDENKRREMLSKWQNILPQVDKRADLFIYFFHWSHQHLQKGGRSIFLCADGWLDSKYGQSLKNEILTDEYHLEKIISWPWKSLFRDDTCPIVTIIKKTDQSKISLQTQTTTLEVDDTNPLDKKNPSIFQNGHKAIEQKILSKEDMRIWLSDSFVNSRQQIVTNPRLYEKMDGFLSSIKDKSIKFSDISTISTFSYSMQDLIKSGIAKEKDDKSINCGVPIFFQKQARVGKPVDYRQFRTSQSLSHYAILADDKLSLKVQRLGFREGGIWISQAIDRFPLLFSQDRDDPKTKWIGVSKYLHASMKNEGDEDIVLAILSSTPSLITMERRFKEGTRKTLRVNENGYAKEIRKQDVENLPIIDYRLFPDEITNKIRQIQKIKGARSLFRMENVMQDKDWLEIDNLILSQLGFDPTQQQSIRNTLLQLYWRRMRNTKEYVA